MGHPRQIITCPRAAARPLWPLPRVVCAARRGVCRTPACALGMCQPWYLAYRMCVSVFFGKRIPVSSARSRPVRVRHLRVHVLFCLLHGYGFMHTYMCFLTGPYAPRRRDTTEPHGTRGTGPTRRPRATKD